MLFKDVIGQGASQAQLRQMVANDRLPHALLLLGPAGSGKLALALALAQYILCESPAADDACGHCRNCLKAARLIHPDLHFAFPAVGTNVTSDTFLPQWRSALLENPYLDVNQWLQLIGAENRQGNINKEECVQIVRKLSLKTFEADRKVLILWLPEYLGREGNRLLKIIEEPPDSTHFILVAEDPELILGTILSRCQIVKVPPLTDGEVVAGLLALRAVDNPQQAAGIAPLADGDFNQALILAEQKENNNTRLFIDWLRKCYKGNGVEMVKWTDQFATLGRESQKHLLAYGLHFLREFMVLKLAGDDQVRLQPAEKSTAEKLTPLIQLDQLDHLVNLLSECSYHVERNANPKVLFLDASIRMHRILQRKEAPAAMGNSG